MAPLPLQIFQKVHLWWGYSRIHATGGKLKVEMVSDLDGEVYDSVTFEKPRDWGTVWHEENGEPRLKEVRCLPSAFPCTPQCHTDRTFPARWQYSLGLVGPLST
jgi:hypothetical protein